MGAPTSPRRHLSFIADYVKLLSRHREDVGAPIQGLAFFLIPSIAQGFGQLVHRHGVEIAVVI